jgi:outer membrane protein W
MKNGVKSIFMVALVLFLLVPINAFARDVSPYIAVKPGIYSPQSSDLEDFDTGFSGEIVLGARANSNFAAEFGFGYFETEDEETFAGVVDGSTFTERDKADVGVFPITFTLKGIIPYQKWEFYGLGGAGAYVVSGELKASGVVDGTPFSIKLDDTETVLGGFLGGGLHYNITPKFFIGIEAKYLWTSDVELEDQVLGVPIEAQFKMDGIIASAVIGIRF